MPSKASSQQPVIWLAICAAVVLLGCTIPSWTLNSNEGTLRPGETLEGQALDVPTVSTANLVNPVEAAMLPAARADLASLSPDLTMYQIDLSVDYAHHSFQAHSRVAYTNTEDIPLDSLYFRLLPNGHKSYGDGSLTVSQVEAEGKQLRTVASLSSSVLQVSLPEPLKVGNGIRLDFDFSGVLPENFGENEGAAGYGIYDFSQGVMTLSGWYPILAVYDAQGWHLDPVSTIGDSVFSETAYYQVSVTAQSNLLLASTGVEIGQKQISGQLSHEIISGPVRDFVLVLGPEYKLLSEFVDGARINSYYLPGHQAGGQAALQVAADALHAYNQRFGAYPFIALDVVESPMRYALGVEYPTLVLISSALYGESEGDNFMGAVVHEIAHQWWYSIVGNDVINEPWLDESLATYSSSLYYEDKFGKAGYQGFIQYLQKRYDSLLSTGKDDLVTQKLDYFEGLNDPSVYSRVVYSKGALFYKALRDEIGDQAFFAGLQAYYRKHKYNVATTEDLLSAFEVTSGKNLNDLYQTWLYSARK